MRRVAAACGLAALAGLAWWPTTRVGFLVVDDYAYLRAAAQGWAGLRADLSASGLPFIGFRPLAMAWYALGLALGGHPIIFRVMLLVTHLGAGWLVHRLARRAGASPAAVGVAAGVFLLTAANTETLNWLACLTIPLGTLLALIALECHEAGRPAWAAAGYAASLAASPILFWWPVVAAAGDVVRRRRPWRWWLCYLGVAAAWFGLQEAWSPAPGKGATGGLYMLSGLSAFRLIGTALTLPPAILLPLPSSGVLSNLQYGGGMAAGWLALASVKLAVSAGCALALLRTWRSGPSGRAAVAWLAAVAAPLCGRVVLDSRHLYPIAAALALSLAPAMHWPAARPLGREPQVESRATPALLAICLGAAWVLFHLAGHFDMARRYAAASSIGRSILAQAVAATRGVPSGRLVAFEGLPGGVERLPLFSKEEHLQEALNWLRPGRSLRVVDPVQPSPAVRFRYAGGRLARVE